MRFPGKMNMLGCSRDSSASTATVAIAVPTAPAIRRRPRCRWRLTARPRKAR